jgi:G3E family GTPase
MKLKDVLQLFSVFGVTFDPKLLALVLTLGAAAVVLAVKGYQWWKARRAKPSPETPLGVAGAEQGATSSRRLWQSWQRFLERLPKTHQRSILNFEHFLIVGVAGSGKSYLLDHQSDWAYQMRQVARQGAVDTELPVVMASGSVVAQLPAQLLEDPGAATRAALDGLWKRLYRDRAPTVVMVVDAKAVQHYTHEELTRQARAVRIRVNQLANIRKRPIEVRVALSHLDLFPGFTESAKFWANESISNRIPLALEGACGPSLKAWVDETRVQLPRALAVSTADDFRKILAFLRTTGEWVPHIEVLLDVLFAREPTSVDPIRGGVYLCADGAGHANPIRNARERGRGPDPLRKHLIGVTVSASAIITYCLMAYMAQRDAWTPAAQAMEAYKVSPTTLDSPSELEDRALITAFTTGPRGVRGSFPAFFGPARARMAQRFVSTLREDLLIPRLRQIAIHGGLLDKYNNTLRWRRSIYFLALIHSDQDDRLRILDDKRLHLFVEMTGLPVNLIRDYLANSKYSYQDAVSFELQDDPNPYDEAKTWLEFPDRVARAMSDGLLRQAELDDLKALIQRLRPALARFEHDADTMKIKAGLGRAANDESDAVDLQDDSEEKLKLETHDTSGQAAGQLQAFYDEKFERVIGICEKNKMYKLHDLLNDVFDIVESANISTELANDGAAPLTHLINALNVVQQSPSQVASAEIVALPIAETVAQFDPKVWRATLARSKAQARIEQFVAEEREADSLFFTAADDERLPDVEWNATGSSKTLFQGRATLRGRYTEVGFEQNVKNPLQQLIDVMDGLSVEPTTLDGLRRELRSGVSEYAQAYASEARLFLSAFHVRTPNPMALRVVLGQVSDEASAFDEFVHALDSNTNLNLKPTPIADQAQEAALPISASSSPSASASGAPMTSAAASSAPAPSAPGAVGPADLRVKPRRNSLNLESLLEPMKEVVSEFEPWHRAVGGEGKGSELSKYKEIAKQALSDLMTATPAGDDGAAGATLEDGLSPAGKSSLASVKATTGAYLQLVEEWANSAGLQPPFSTPFLAPFRQLSQLGNAELDDFVGNVWRDEMLPLVRQASSKFPFDPKADDAITPDELTELFHPTDGQFFRLFRSYLEPVSSFGDGQPFRPLPRGQGALRYPSDLYPTVNAVAALAARLWDADGKPQAIELEVYPVPFTPNSRDEVVPTLVQLNLGASSVFNFNQKPSPTKVTLDWTADEPAQIGVQTVDVKTRESFRPAALAAEGPNWRLFRLLRLGHRVSADEGGNGGYLYEWVRPTRDGEKPSLPIRVRFATDPWQLFALPRGTSRARQ